MGVDPRLQKRDRAKNIGKVWFVVVLPNRTTHVLTTPDERRLDSIAQSCGLSLPTFNQRGWFMSSSIDAAASPACIASTSPASRQQKRVDFLTRYCGLSLPTLFKRIGIMAVDGQPLPTRFDAARLRRVSRPELAWHTGNPSLGPVKTPPTIIASGPADGQAAAIPMRVGKGFGGPISLRTRHRPSSRPDLPMRLHRRGSTTGNGWWSPSRQAGRSLSTHPGDNA